MIALIAIAALIAGYFLYQKFTKHEKALGALKTDFNKILEIVEPVINAGLEEEEAPPPPQQRDMKHNPQTQEAATAKPYGWRKRSNEETPPAPSRGPGQSVEIPPPLGQGGVSLEALTGGMSEYAQLF